MKKKISEYSLVLLVGIVLLSFTQKSDSESYTVKPDQSEMQWTARKVGGQHSGILKLKSGSFSVEDGLITSGTFVMDMTTIELTDSESKKLLNHLKGKDFFNVEKFKESKLVITGSKMKDSAMHVSANLTIVGITNPISFVAKNVGKTDDFRIYSGTLTVDRTKYGIVYRSSAVGDAFIKDEFDVKVKITGEKLLK
jgi:polyisoprenoid-binding protein YceI